jgi:hypothetical protein
MARAPLVPWVAAYLGGSPASDRAVVEWSFAYAQQVERDFEAFVAGEPSQSTRRKARKA